jgi:2'-5' RNA ligase
MNNSEYIRSFVCVAPTRDAAGEIAGYVARLRRFGGYRWVTPDQIHITVRFLGEAAPSLLQKLDTALSALGGFEEFDIALNGVGGFPNIFRPRALWLGAVTGAQELGNLASRVEQAARRSGFAPLKRKFNAHLTIARARSEGPLPEELAVELKNAPKVKWTCRSFVLMKSALSPSGAVYTPLREYPLG